MTNVIQPFHLLVIALAGWLNRHQQAVIDYLIEENRVLKEQLEGQRLRFTDEQRIRLTEGFRGHLDREGVKPVRYPVRAPNCNAFAERFVRSIKDECLGRMILFGEASLRRALRAYVVHYHTERNHRVNLTCYHSLFSHFTHYLLQR